MPIDGGHRYTRPMARLWRNPSGALISTLAALALAVGGCEGNRASDNSQSVFDLLPAAPTPAQAAEWMFDPYDPDKRFRGTVLLANAPFGGTRQYVDGYVL